MTTALFVDTHTRKIEVSSVEVTEVPGVGLVMRFGALLGQLEDLVTPGREWVIHVPVLVATKGFTARSSAGQVAVLGEERPRVPVVGIQGMPWMKAKALKALAEPIEVVVFQWGSTIRGVETHARREDHSASESRFNSSVGSADAAIRGINLLREVRPSSVFVTERQSDRAQAWELKPRSSERFEGDLAGLMDPEWDLEHRAERFTLRVLVDRALWRRHDSPEAAEGAIRTWLGTTGPVDLEWELQELGLPRWYAYLLAQAGASALDEPPAAQATEAPAEGEIVELEGDDA